MKEYNAAFFGLYENWFLAISREFGNEKAIELFRKVMEDGLAKTYGNDFIKGNPDEFVRLVGERDKNVGLVVTFPRADDTEIVYRFHTDPFPGLKGKVPSELLDDTFITFKARYILGNNWRYETTSHIWRGDTCTEFRIFNTLYNPINSKIDV